MDSPCQACLRASAEAYVEFINRTWVFTDAIAKTRYFKIVWETCHKTTGRARMRHSRCRTRDTRVFLATKINEEDDARIAHEEAKRFLILAQRRARRAAIIYQIAKEEEALCYEVSQML